MADNLDREVGMSVSCVYGIAETVLTCFRSTGHQTRNRRTFSRNLIRRAVGNRPDRRPVRAQLLAASGALGDTFRIHDGIE